MNNDPVREVTVTSIKISLYQAISLVLTFSVAAVIVSGVIGVVPLIFFILLR